MSNGSGIINVTNPVGSASAILTSKTLDKIPKSLVANINIITAAIRKYGSIVRARAASQAYSTTRASDVVGVFDASFNQLFETARPVRANVLEDSTLFKHPLETGYTIADHRVINPIEINFIVKLPAVTFRDAYNSIKAGFLAGNTYTIRTRTGSYPNMIMAAIPHEEKPEDWESIPVFLTFIELQTASATYSPISPRRARDGDTVDKGQQQGKSSVAYDILQWGKNKVAN